MNKIFLIDDDEDDTLLFKEAIETINTTLQCDTATNGKMALAQLKAGTVLPDIIFLDLNMPIMNGFDFLVQIKKEEQFNKIPVGIFSTSNHLSDEEKIKKLGAWFFLTKPNNFEVLCKQLQQILSADFSTQEYISIRNSSP